MRDAAGVLIHHQTAAQNFAFSPKKPMEIIEVHSELVLQRVSSSARSGSAAMCAGVRDRAFMRGSKYTAERKGRPSGESWKYRGKCLEGGQ
jgi:hypothetical protein